MYGSTRTALDYFEYLHGMFNDWQLALAAYNWGEGKCSRAVERAKRSHKATDYAHLKMSRDGQLRSKLRLSSASKDPGRYGIELPDVGNEPFFVRITKASRY